jgi:hypothetical protein
VTADPGAIHTRADHRGDRNGLGAGNVIGARHVFLTLACIQRACGKTRFAGSGAGTSGTASSLSTFEPVMSMSRRQTVLKTQKKVNGRDIGVGAPGAAAP